MKKQRIHVLALFLCAAALCTVLCACGQKTRDVPVADLRDAVCQALGKSDMADPGENYVKGYMKKTAQEIGDYVIMKNVMGTNIDEFGIFKAGTLSTDELKTMAEDYLKILRDSWMNYQPEEEPKLTGAEVKVLGDYVMYCILSDADKTTAFDAFTAALK